MNLRSVIGLGLLIFATSPRCWAADPPLRVLILSSESDAGLRATTPVLRRILTDSGRFDMRLCESPAGLSARTLEGFDLVVNNGADADTEKAIATFVESGKGLLIARGGLNDSAPAGWPVLAGGKAAASVGFLDVRMTQPDHPIVAGMKAEFRTADAIPRGLSGGETIVSAAVADDPNVPVLAASRTGRGRVVALSLGHDASAMHEPSFRVLLARAAEWAATEKVTLPAETATTGPRPGSVKALLITGGHDHEAAFYGLFNGDCDIDWLPVDTAANAFKKDLRGKYDVLIMYDFTRDLDDAARKNLRDFVEAGHGVVVLHHALLNYQTWTWWSEEVVGGRYRLQREGKAPSSGVKDDQSILVSLGEPHPVLDGLGPFHITDEAYKNLAMSDKIRPLLTTDNPTSDVNLAWIGPCKTARVVAIQLGHGHSAFGHPSYRTLVHNAVLWAAGKAKSDTSTKETP